MAGKRHAILGVVELLADSGRWPVGTVGTVEESKDELVLVEISDNRGHALELISTPHHALASRRRQATDRIAC